MSKVTQDIWHHTHEEWHHSADSCGCAVKWYCLWLSPLASYVCLDLSGIAQTFCSVRAELDHVLKPVLVTICPTAFAINPFDVWVKIQWCNYIFFFFVLNIQKKPFHPISRYSIFCL